MASSKTGGRKIRLGLILMIILGTAVLGIMAVFLADAPQRRELSALTMEDIDFGAPRDGTYIGEYAGTKGSARNAAVEVTVSGGKITEITPLEGALDQDGNLAELTDGMTIGDLFKRVTDAESLQVDVISGATLTSKAHLKALENALKQALKP